MRPTKREIRVYNRDQLIGFFEFARSGIKVFDLEDINDQCSFWGNWTHCQEDYGPGYMTHTWADLNP